MTDMKWVDQRFQNSSISSDSLIKGRLDRSCLLRQMLAFPYNQMVFVGRSEARKPAGSLSLMEMELWSLEPIGDETFEEMRDSGEDNRTKSIVVDEVEVTLVGWDMT